MATGRAIAKAGEGIVGKAAAKVLKRAAKPGVRAAERGAAKSADNVVVRGVDNVALTRGLNTKTTRFGPNGRPISETGTIRQDFGGGKRGDNATAIGRTGKAGDQGGHLGAHRFFGDTYDEGIVPQAGNLNQGPWKSMENEWADWVNKGYQVDYSIRVVPPGAVRPDRFEVRYTVTNPHTGEVVHKRTPSLLNQAGQTFDRMPSADIPTL